MRKAQINELSRLDVGGNAGCIYEEYYNKGKYNGYSRSTGYIRYVAEIVVAGERFRHRSMDRKKVEDWLKAVRSGHIKPTQKGADWMLMEQRKNMELRNYETIVSAAEEAVLVMNFAENRDIQPINKYMQERLLPHMVYYCCHTLCLGMENSLNYTKQAAALIYTMLFDGKPITNMTKRQIHRSVAVNGLVQLGRIRFATLNQSSAVHDRRNTLANPLCDFCGYIVSNIQSVPIQIRILVYRFSVVHLHCRIRSRIIPLNEIQLLTLEIRLLLHSGKQLFRDLFGLDPLVTVHCGNLVSIVVINNLVFFLHDLLLPVLCLFLGC